METDFYVLAELIKDYLGLVHSVKVSKFLHYLGTSDSSKSSTPLPK
jgi:hypothetical protein